MNNQSIFFSPPTQTVVISYWLCPWISHPNQWFLFDSFLNALKCSNVRKTFNVFDNLDEKKKRNFALLKLQRRCLVRSCVHFVVFKQIFLVLWHFRPSHSNCGYKYRVMRSSRIWNRPSVFDVLILHFIEITKKRSLQNSNNVEESMNGCKVRFYSKYLLFEFWCFLRVRSRDFFESELLGGGRSRHQKRRTNFPE